MKTKNLKRKLKAQPGGSLPVGSEMLGRIMCLEYYLDATAQDLQHRAAQLTNISDRLTEIRQELSPNKLSHRRPAAQEHPKLYE